MTEGERNTDPGSRRRSISQDPLHRRLRESLQRQEKKRQALVCLWEALRADDGDAIRLHAGELCRLSGLPVKETGKEDRPLAGGQKEP